MLQHFAPGASPRLNHGCGLTLLKAGDTFSGPRFLLASSGLQHTPDTPFEQAHMVAKRPIRRPDPKSRHAAERGFLPLACCAVLPHSFSVLTQCIPSFVSSHIALPLKEAAHDAPIYA